MKIIDCFIDSGERPFRFDENGEVFGDFLTRYYFAASLTKDKSVLDIGCGLGYGSYALAQKGASFVLGIDHSSKAIEEARTRYSFNSLRFELGFAGDLLKERQRFDVIVAFEIIEHLKKPEVFLREIYDLLSPDGILIISTPNKEFWSPGRRKPLNPFHLKEYEPIEFFQMLEGFFPCVDRFGLDLTVSGRKKEEKGVDQIKNRGLIETIGNSRIVRRLLVFIPSKIKMRFTGEDKIIPPKYSDFQITEFASGMRSLIAVCYKTR